MSEVVRREPAVPSSHSKQPQRFTTQNFCFGHFSRMNMYQDALASLKSRCCFDYELSGLCSHVFGLNTVFPKFQMHMRTQTINLHLVSPATCATSLSSPALCFILSPIDCNAPRCLVHGIGHHSLCALSGHISGPPLSSRQAPSK